MGDNKRKVMNVRSCVVRICLGKFFVLGRPTKLCEHRMFLEKKIVAVISVDCPHCFFVFTLRSPYFMIYFSIKAAQKQNPGYLTYIKNETNGKYFSCLQMPMV